MAQPRHFGIDQPSVVSETIDGEAVILDLRSGAYYSARGTGAAIWTWLEAGASVDAIIAHLLATFPDHADTARVSTEAFVDELVARRLVVPRVAPSDDVALAAFPMAFAAPSLERYTDMDDLLLLDPIHDVDLVGWPVPRPERDGD